MINRGTFVALCTQAIEKTRKEIAIRNQVSGYLKYRKAIKNDYFITAREQMLSEQLYINNKKYRLQVQHAIIKHIKMGSCNELAEYVGFEVLTFLKKLDVNAELRIVQSNSMEHFFVHVVIKLKDEIQTKWEIDAWHPRIIDITTQSDGSIKNSESLIYGTDVSVRYTISVNDFIMAPPIKLSIYDSIDPPESDTPEDDATPERMVQEKYPFVLSDHTVEDSYTDKLLDRIGSNQLGYLRKVSSWQKKPSIMSSSLPSSSTQKSLSSEFETKRQNSSQSSSLPVTKAKDAKKPSHFSKSKDSLPFSITKKQDIQDKEQYNAERNSRTKTRMTPY